jgi:hypothetical protein
MGPLSHERSVVCERGGPVGGSTTSGSPMPGNPTFGNTASAARRSRIPGRSAIAAAAGAALCVLLLAGCVDAPTDVATPTASATSTPTPTETAQAAPTTDAQAIAAAKKAVERFYAARAEVNTAGSVDTSPLALVAIGPALQVVTDDAGRIAADKNTVTGVITFQPASAYSSDVVAADGTSVPFNAVHIVGCQDGTQYKLTLPDGSAVQQPAEQRNELELTVVFDPAGATWLVQGITATGKTC